MVLLIIPPSGGLIDQRVFPFLGVLKVAEALRRDGNDCEILDLSGREAPLAVLEDYMFSGEYGEYGITATTPVFPEAYKIMEFIRRYQPGAYIFLGGSHASVIPRMRDTDPRKEREMDNLTQYADCVVVGFGESIVNKIIRDRLTGIVTSYKNLDIPLARDLIKVKSYKYDIDGAPTTSLVCTTGCPYQCGFCSGRNSPLYNKVNYREYDSIIEEISGLHKDYGFTGFMFYDDEINVNKTRFKELMKRLIQFQKERGLDLSFRGFTRADLMDTESADLMVQAGFKWLLSGFESASDRILKNINKGKNISVRVNTQCIEVCRAAGLKIKALMSIGHPGENNKTVSQLKGWVADMKPESVDVSIITAYPGSKYYDEAVPFKENIYKYTVSATGDSLYIHDQNLSEVSTFYKGKPGEYRPSSYTDKLSEDDLVDKRDELSTYFREEVGLDCR